MARQMLAVVGILSVVAACSGSGAEPSTTVSTLTVPTVTTTTTTAPVIPPRLGSSLAMFPIPIRVVEDAVLRVDGSCVTAETGDKTLLLIFDLILANVVGDEVWLEDRDPDTPTLRVLSSGVRYQIRGVPDPFDAELKEPLPPGCEYDERLILLGALDTPVGHGLRTRPVEGWEAVGGMGYDGTPTITIAGACTTVIFTGWDRELLVVWPAGTVSLLDDHTIHMSRWEALFTEAVVKSGDPVTLVGQHSDFSPDDPVPDCEYDGTFFAEAIRPASE
jgi:hypothetical protein